MVKGGRGFTLIELLVVIAIIGVLAAVVLASLGTARQNAADAQRVSDLNQLRSAVEMYHLANGRYPNPGGGWRSTCSSWGGYAPGNVIPGLVPKYIPEMPEDPQRNGTTNQNCYLYNSNGRDYKILNYNLINTGTGVEKFYSLMDPRRNYGLNRPSGCSNTEATRTLAVYSGTASMCW